MKKKLVVLTVGAALSFALLTGCGTPSAKDLVDGMYDTQVESANLNLFVDVDLSVKLDGEKKPIKASANVDMEISDMVNVYDSLMHISGDVDYNALDLLKGKQDFNMYLETAEDEATIYLEQDGDWVRTTSELPEQAEVDEKTQKKIQDAAKEVWYNAKVDKKTEKIEDEECYVLRLSTTLNDYVPVIDVAVKEMDMEDQWEEMVDTLEEEYDIKLADFYDCFKVESVAYVSKKNKYMVATDVDFSGIDVDKILELMDTDLDSLGALIGQDVSDFAINKLVFETTLSDINDTKVKLSKEAEDAEETSLGGIPSGFGDDMYGGDNWSDDDDDDDDWSDDSDDDDDDDDMSGDDDSDDADDDSDEANADDYYDDDKFISKKHYDKEKGIIELTDFGSDVVMKMAVPEGYKVTYAAEYGSSFMFEVDGSSFDYEKKIDVSSYNNLEVQEFIENGTKSDFYDDLWAETEEYKIGDYDCLFVTWGYDPGEAFNYEPKNYEMWIPYTNSDGDKYYVSVEFREALIENWDKNDYVEFFEKLLMID